MSRVSPQTRYDCGIFWKVVLLKRKQGRAIATCQHTMQMRSYFGDQEMVQSPFYFLS